MSTVTANAKTYTIDDIIAELQRLVYYIAEHKSRQDNIMMDFDELVGELSEEIVKGYEHYKDKGLTQTEMIKVIKRMLSNRIGELVYKYYITHRNLGLNYLPVDELDEWVDDGVINYIPSRVYVEMSLDATPTPQSVMESRERVEELMGSVSPNAQLVLQAILNGNELLSMNVLMSMQRASYVFKDVNVSLQPWHVAEGVGISDSEATAAFDEIRRVYASIMENELL